MAVKSRATQYSRTRTPSRRLSACSEPVWEDMTWVGRSLPDRALSVRGALLYQLRAGHKAALRRVHVVYARGHDKHPHRYDG